MKTVCILYARKTPKEKPKISLIVTELKWIDTVKHLGNYFDANMREHTEVLRKRGDLVPRVNYLLVSLGSSPDAIIRKAFNTQCAHLYGVMAWNFSDRSVSDFQIMWNRCVKRMFQLPYATHTRLLPIIMCISSITDQIYGRFLKLWQVMQHSENDKVIYLTHLCISSARSIIGSNHRIVGKRLNKKTKESF